MANKINIESVAYILGILSIVFGFISPLAGLIIGIIGLNQSKKKNVKEAKKLNTIGITISIIVLIIVIITFFYSLSTGTGELFPLQ